MTTKPIMTGGTAALLALMGSASIANAHTYHGYSATVYSTSEPYLALSASDEDDEDDYITTISRQFDIEDDEGEDEEDDD